jgi:hypothetical protein
VSRPEFNKIAELLAGALTEVEERLRRLETRARN